MNAANRDLTAHVMTVVLKWFGDPPSHRKFARERAELRRAASEDEACACPGFFRLLHMVEAAQVEDGEVRRPSCSLPPYERDTLLRLAMLLSRVRANKDNEPLARQMADDAKGRPKVSELRFRRLLASEGSDAQLRAWRRIIHLLGREINIADLTRVMWTWNAKTRKKLAYDYYAHLPQKKG